MALESWIDALAARWGTIEAPGQAGKLVRSYALYERQEFPDALATFPCALSYPLELWPEYSVGGPCIDLWRGVSEFHLFPNTSKAHLPAVMLYFARIRAAAAATLTLGSRVSHFLIRHDIVGIRGPLGLQYGSEQEHWGLLVNWEVKENVSGAFAVAA